MSTSETFAEFRKAAKEKADRERGLKEQQVVIFSQKQRHVKRQSRMVKCGQRTQPNVGSFLGQLLGIIRWHTLHTFILYCRVEMFCEFLCLL